MPKASITANHCIEKSSVSKPLLSPKSLGLASSSTSKFEYLNSQSETLDCGFCTEAELIESMSFVFSAAFLGMQISECLNKAQKSACLK